MSKCSQPFYKKFAEMICVCSDEINRQDYWQGINIMLLTSYWKVKLLNEIFFKLLPR